MLFAAEVDLEPGREAAAVVVHVVQVVNETEIVEVETVQLVEHPDSNRIYRWVGEGGPYERGYYNAFIQVGVWDSEDSLDAVSQFYVYDECEDPA